MGARMYLPILGRFLQVDPVEGGTDNNYVYANDPVNEFDLDGRWIRDAWNNTKKAVKSAAKWVSRHQEGIKNGLIAVSVGACVVATAGVCGAVAVATAIRKAPARKRFAGIILWGARRYAVQQVSSYAINRIQNRYRR
ncbi:MAG: RHS repeat-associated core domain-containing protein [Candidatus Saccharibacteria bacterium]|nr:RHS repeat-associated core domain-containing protein [Candidatus Saccharibacteria bacterium]